MDVDILPERVNGLMPFIFVKEEILVNHTSFLFHSDFIRVLSFEFDSYDSTLNRQSVFHDY